MELSTKAALLLIAIVLVLLFVPLPDGGRVANALQDLAHVPVGALLAWAIWGQLHHRLSMGAGPAAFLSFVLVVVVLAGVEAIQPFLGRGRSLEDLTVGVLAAAGALTITVARGSVGVTRAGGWLLGLALLGLAAWPGGRILGDFVRLWRTQPLLASFEDDLELTRWWFDDAEAARSSEHVTHQMWSLRVDLEPGPYPAATLVGVYPDWRGRTAFALDAWLDGASSLDVVIKVIDASHDETYEDRYQGYVTLHPGENQIRIPMADIEGGPESRAMDLAHIRSVQIFVDGLKAGRTLYLDHVRLTGRGH